MTLGEPGSEFGLSPAQAEGPRTGPSAEEVWSFTPPKPRAATPRPVATPVPPTPRPEGATVRGASQPAESSATSVSANLEAPPTAPAHPLARQAEPGPVAPAGEPLPRGHPNEPHRAGAALSVSRSDSDLPWTLAGGRVSTSNRVLKSLAGVAMILALLGGALVSVAKTRDRGHLIGLSLAAGRDYRFRVTGAFEGKIVTDSSTRHVSETVQGSIAWHVVSLDGDGMATVHTLFSSTSHRVNGKTRTGVHVEAQIVVGRDGRVISVASRPSGDDAFRFALQQLGPLLPDRPSRPGATWGTEFDQKMVSEGETVRLTARSTLVRYDTVDGKSTAVVTNDLEVPASSAGKGSIYQQSSFDPVRGLVESSITARVDLAVTAGHKGDSPSRTIGTVTLQIERVRKLAATGRGGGPTTGEAADGQARDLLRRALSAADVYFTANQSYVGLTPLKASSISNSIRWMRDGKAEPSIVTIRKTRTTSILLVTVSDSGTKYCVARTGERIRYGRIGATWPSGCSGGW